MTWKKLKGERFVLEPIQLVSGLEQSPVPLDKTN